MDSSISIVIVLSLSSLALSLVALFPLPPFVVVVVAEVTARSIFKFIIKKGLTN